MDEQIRTRLDDTRRKLFEHFDEDVHQRLRLQLDDAKAQLDRFGQRFWSLTRFMLDGRARFDDAALAFDLERPPRADIPTGPLPPDLEVASRSERGPTRTAARSRAVSSIACRTRSASMSWTSAKALPTPPARIVFDVTHHPTRLSRSRGAAREERLPDAHPSRDRVLRARGIPAVLRLRRGRRLARPGDDGEALRLLPAESQMTGSEDAIPASVRQRLAGEAERHAQGHQSAARWSRTARTSTRRARSWRSGPTTWCSRPRRRSQDTKEQIKALRRQARQAVTLEEQHEIQEKIQKLERQQRRQRQEIFKVEDEIMEKRDQLIDSLEKPAGAADRDRGPLHHPLGGRVGWPLEITNRKGRDTG